MADQAAEADPFEGYRPGGHHAIARCGSGEYSIGHAVAAFGVMQADAVMMLAKRAWGWIERHEVATFPVRDLQRGLNDMTREELDPALRRLRERGFIRPGTERNTYDVHPDPYTRKPSTTSTAYPPADSPAPEPIDSIADNAPLAPRASMLSMLLAVLRV